MSFTEKKRKEREREMCVEVSVCPTFENLCEERILDKTLNIFWFKIQRRAFLVCFPAA